MFAGAAAEHGMAIATLIPSPNPARYDEAAGSRRGNSMRVRGSAGAAFAAVQRILAR
jgi:hypothetical protein